MKRGIFISLLIVLLSGTFLQNCKHEIPTPVVFSNDCDPDTIYFVNQVLPVIQSSCAMSGCHDHKSRREGVELTSYSKIMKTGGVTAFNSGGSMLYEVLISTHNRMPPPPASLTISQIQNIKNWIDQGALNNECLGCDTSNTTYISRISNVISTNCVGCHNSSLAEKGVLLETYSEVKDIVNDGRLQDVLDGTNGYSVMPPYPAVLTDCSKNQIRHWIETGAPQN
ncbi:MAG: hypothetical protein GC181_00935 [Bacteroidetes bacterium]|nr:hypothetical protein [Bacteroidota bacterium]